MKTTIALLICLLVTGQAMAQHSVQLDDGLGHYSLIQGSTSGGIYILPSGGGTLLTAPTAGNASLAWLTHGNFLLDSDWTNNIFGTLDNNQLRIVTNATTRILVGANGTTTINDSAYALTSIGNGSANTQLVINGVNDAVSGDPYPPGGSPEWDLDVRGDAAINGIARFGNTGASIWIDGSSFPNSMNSDSWLALNSSFGPLLLNDANGQNTNINATQAAATTIGTNSNGSTINLNAPVITAANIPTGSTATSVIVSNAGTLETRDMASFAWQVSGNAGTTAGTNFLGTTDAQAIDLRANNVVRLRLNTNASIQHVFDGDPRGNEAIDLQTTRAATTDVASGTQSVIGGGQLNSATNTWAIVAGGSDNHASGMLSVISGGGLNTATNLYSAVSGGQFNNSTGMYAGIGSGRTNAASGDYSRVGGGESNTSGGSHSVVAGGSSNSIGASDLAVISGGTNNSIGAGSGASAIGGGNTNSVGAASVNSTIGGGVLNTVAGGVTGSTIGGGSGNGTTTGSDYATIGGGQSNNATNIYATVGGGSGNTASGAGSVVGGGGHATTSQPNSAGGDASTVGGGILNSASGAGSFVGGGGYDGTTAAGNTASGNASAVGGGVGNTASGNYSAIPGGRGLSLSGNGSFGYLGGNTGSNDMSVSAANTSVLGNTDLWLANNDNTARALYFYAPNNTTGAFPGSTNYVGFKAGAVGTSVIWTLPLADATVSGQYMVSDAAGTLSWAGPAVGGSGTAGTIPIWSTATSLGNSLLTDNGTTLSYSGTHINSATDFQIGGTTVIKKIGASNFFAGQGSGNTGVTGTDNTGVGLNSLGPISTGSGNSAVGAYALATVSTGSANTAMGEYAYMSGNGDQNVAIGEYSMQSNTGSRNTAVGYQTLVSASTASQNTVVGWSALGGVSTAATTNNTAVGLQALGSNGAGSANTGVGMLAGLSNNGGTNNTFVGFFADATSATLTNATAIGNGAKVAASNTMQFGDASVTLVNTSGAYNTSTGYRVGGAAASGTVLRGSGTNYVASTTTFPNSATTGDLMYASGANAYGNLSDVATGSVLLSGGVGAAPSYGQVTNAVVASGTFSNITGIGAQSQALNMNTHLINGVVDPVAAQDAATKNYVDGKVNASVSGTTDNIPKFTSANVIGNSSITDNGTTVATSEAVSFTGGATITGATNVNTTGSAGTSIGSSSGGNIALTTNPFGFIQATVSAADVTGTTPGWFEVNNLTTNTGGSVTKIAQKINSTGAMTQGSNTGLYITATGGFTGNTGIGFSVGNAFGGAWDLVGTAGWNVTNAGAATFASGSFNGAVNMNTHLINGVVDPVAAQDAATKNYVDTKVSGAVAAGTTGQLAIYTGANAVGSTNLSGDVTTTNSAVTAIATSAGNNIVAALNNASTTSNISNTAINATLKNVDASTGTLQTAGTTRIDNGGTFTVGGNVIYPTESDAVNGPLGTNTVTVTGNKTIAIITDATPFANANVAVTVTNATTGQILIIQNTTAQNVVLNGTTVAANAVAQFVYLGSWLHIQ